MGYIKGNIIHFVQPVGMKDFSVLFNARKMPDLIKFDFGHF